MSVPQIVKGGYFDVAVDATNLGVSGVTGWVHLCGLNTRNLTHQVNTSDEAVPDCDNPARTPWRVLNDTSQQKDMAGSGLYNIEQEDLLRAMFGKTLPMRFIKARPDATDPNIKVPIGAWGGPFKFSNWQEGASDGTNVTAGFTFNSDGEVLWIPAATLIAEAD